MFRNLADSETVFHPQVNLFLGDNGQGKTNFLEAIYFLATTKSFRTSRVAPMARFGSSTIFVSGELERTAIVRKLSAGVEITPHRRRELMVNREPVTLSDYLGAVQVFAYASARLEIIRGGPDERRRFIDRGIASVDPSYLDAMTRYGRVLRQRNALLQDSSLHRGRGTALEAWDEELLSAAAPLTRGRDSYISRLQERFDAIVETHDYHLRDVRLRYQPALTGQTEEDRRQLSSIRRRELAAGFSLLGPHRDVIEIDVAGRPAGEVVSGGELKVTVLFLELAKSEIFREHAGESPLFVLDDLDAELDRRILEALVQRLASSSQLFTSSAKEELVSSLPFGSHSRYEVREGGAKCMEKPAK
jgi:DNA replication and repair protein RecF